MEIRSDDQINSLFEGQTEINEPIDLLQMSLNSKVLVKMRHGRQLTGKLIVSLFLLVFDYSPNQILFCWSLPQGIWWAFEHYVGWNCGTSQSFYIWYTASRKWLDKRCIEKQTWIVDCFLKRRFGSYGISNWCLKIDRTYH